MPGFVSLDYAHATLLQGTAALPCDDGIIAVGGDGTARDTLFIGAYILLNATAVTLTVTGLNDNTGVAASMILTGQTTIDQWFIPPYPILNEFAVFTFQPSVAAKVWVFTRAYQGP